MREIRTLLVDDEPLANEGLRVLLQRHADVKVIGECRDGREAVEQIRRDAPDVVFLDVQMPELDGFGVLRELGCDLSSVLIFVTAHDEYAMRAFDVQAIDYLLKPAHEDKLDRALQRVRRQLEGNRALDLSQRLATLLADQELATQQEQANDDRAVSGSHAARNSYLSRLTVRTGRKSIALAVSDIDWIAADDYCVNLVVNGRRHLLRASLASLEKKLDPSMFVRVHRSALVNITRVKEWHQQPFRRMVLVLTDKTQLQVSRSRKAQLLALLS
ncbi:MAG TPA: LytTR family DNA-binding domain-containing protein, partial [Gemmatimonadaceae bacterium]|jgi:two-component system LytT family response regulator